MEEVGPKEGHGHGSDHRPSDQPESYAKVAPALSMQNRSSDRIHVPYRLYAVSPPLFGHVCRT
jgi:hypothetical protein